MTVSNISKKISPWDVTPMEAEAMDAMCEHGCVKLAARALNKSTKTIELHVYTVNQKMGFPTNRLKKFIAWDRWRRSSEAPVEKPIPKCCVCGITQGLLRADGAYGHRCSSPNCMVF